MTKTRISDSGVMTAYYLVGTRQRFEQTHCIHIQLVLNDIFKHIQDYTMSEPRIQKDKKCCYFTDLISICSIIWVLQLVIWEGERLARAAGYMDRLRPINT